jgi:hypothetical protein
VFGKDRADLSFEEVGVGRGDRGRDGRAGRDECEERQAGHALTADDEREVHGLGPGFDRAVGRVK